MQAYVLAGIVQRTMSRLRTEVEEKLNRLPLRDVDRMPRGDLLSRVTNDIDNLSQSLQQTLSQMLTSFLTIIGVMVMMITISPLLALVAIVTVPISLFTISFITRRSKTRFVAQWDHTGTLNAQVEEVFTGHELVKVFGRQHDAEQTFDKENEHLFQASFGAQFISGTIQPVMMFIGNLNYVAIAVIGGLRVANGHVEPRRRAGVPPVHAAVHAAAHAAGVDGQPAAVGDRVGRAGLRAARLTGGIGRPEGAPPRRATRAAGSSSATCASPTTRIARSSRTSRWWRNRGRRWRSSAPPERARPRS